MSSIETYSGKLFDLLNPTPEQVDLHDIARSLARVNRFVGHTSVCYSVAEHSLHVLQLVTEWHPTDTLLQAHSVLHDSGEAYVGDLSGPMKETLRQYSVRAVSDFDIIEAWAMNAIWKAFNLPRPTELQKEIIKVCDLQMLMTERAAFKPNTGKWPGEEDCKLEPVPHMLETILSKSWRWAGTEEIQNRFFDRTTALLEALKKESP